jgi:hypothetical protein
MSKRTDQYSLTPYRMEQPSLVFGDFMAIDDGERRLELRRVGPAQLLKEVDLSKHGDFAADAQQNHGAIRQVFRKAPG